MLNSFFFITKKNSKYKLHLLKLCDRVVEYSYLIGGGDSDCDSEVLAPVKGEKMHIYHIGTQNPSNLSLNC